MRVGLTSKGAEVAEMIFRGEFRLPAYWPEKTKDVLFYLYQGPGDVDYYDLGYELKMPWKSVDALATWLRSKGWVEVQR